MRLTIPGLVVLGFALFMLLGSGGCEQGATTEIEQAASKPAKIPEHTAAALDWVKLARASASRLRKRDDAKATRTHYLALRRAVAAVGPLLRIRAQLGSEVLLGPPESATEGGGALAELDRALADKVPADIERALTQVLRALELSHNEVTLNRIPPDEATATLPGSCFELGLLLMEASARTPDAPDAVRADLLGTLDGIDTLAAATAALTRRADQASAQQPLTELKRHSQALRQVIEAAPHSHALKRRAYMVRQSGEMTAAAHALTQAVRVKVAPLYQPLQPLPKANLNPLILPAARKSTDPPQRRAALIALGRKLFFDKRLSKGAQRSCASCHQPDKGLSDGLPTPASLLPNEPIVRNTPTLLYAPLHAAQLWDGRFASATRQAQRVLHAEAEMGLSKQQLRDQVTAIDEYRAALQQWGVGTDPSRLVARALDAFQQHSMVIDHSPLDRFARGETKALSEELSAGFDVLVGPGRCTRCHIPPSFAGSRPPGFNTPIYANLGMLDKPEGKALDPDRGRGAVTGRKADDHLFKTPTLRNLTLTAPYFHHGRFETLEQVVDFYDRGGGRGAGITVLSQDPDVRPLKLTKEQRRALLQLLRVGLADPPEAIQRALGPPAPAK